MVREKWGVTEKEKYIQVFQQSHIFAFSRPGISVVGK
jgi:hypothetical protein